VEFLSQSKKAILPAVSAIGAAISIGSLVLDGVGAFSLGLPLWAWEAIGASIFALSVLAIAVGAQGKVENGGTSRNAPPASGLSLMVFSANRRDRDYVALVQSSSDVSVLWNTGGGLKRAHELRKILPHLARVLLPHPKPGASPSLDALAQAGESTEGKDAATMAASLSEITGAIIQVTRDIQQYNKSNNRKIDVRWRVGLMGSPISLSEEWAFVEQFLPGVGAADRIGYVARKVDQSQVYATLRGSYEYMWSNAVSIDQAFLGN
jgi:hypothetical protein